MRVLILGGDGYLGWPTAMALSEAGYDVALVDNYFRRNACVERDLPPIFPLLTLHERVALWQQLTGRSIQVTIGDITNFDLLERVFQTFKPEAVIDYAEQPSAPYSMLGPREAHFTVRNNLCGTLNLIHAVKRHAPDCHIIKLGTMGEYGTPNIDIEEGWLEVEHKGRREKFLYPRQAGSLYHTTKIQDTDMLWFYVRTWGMRVTDLMQGPVYGMITPQIRRDDRLATCTNYDEIFGTVLNRFLVQAVVGMPLTVYGKGQQTRGYLNLIDTIACIRLAIDHPAAAGELRIMNQFTETMSVNEIAARVCQAAGQMGLNPTVNHLVNPRKEAEEHYYNPTHNKLTALGLQPHLLTDAVLMEQLAFIQRYRARIRDDIILPRTTWA
ncbi:MAG: NAD-dependent epimerase/dehydratase family protein [Magnetococcales bacterium]|nr:NAD-dependent epimerase/dehydratase family protein [Magnetococcales bacterium]